jgi:hypothetical protein
MLLLSCASSKEVANTITVESGEIPADMKKEDFILIGILKGRNSYDKYLKSEFKKYTGNYVLCKLEEIDSKYSDKSKYRYIMDFTQKRDFGSQGTIVDTYYIRDRKDNQQYQRNSGSSFFKLEIRSYLAAIEQARRQR